MFIPTIHGFSTLDITLMVIIFFLVYTLVLKFYKSKQVVVVKDEGKLLYNPNGSDEGSNLIGGDTTNIVNLADIKKPIYLKLFKVAFSNNWIPEKVSNMSMDKYDYEHKLSKELKTIYDTYLSLLIFLDSIQTNNLPNIGKHITLPVALLMLTRQTFDEALHSYSYGYTLTNMMTIEEAEKIVYMWRDNESLSSRNEYITMLYENNKDSNSNRAFLILLIANYILEGVYFYNVFMFFHNLSFMGMMHASNVQIKYIKRDELVHCMFFKEMILQFREENPDDWDEQLVKDMFTEAVKREREFSIETNGDDVLGITPETITDYTYCLGNERLDDINVEQIFPKRKNPYKHLDKLAAIGDETTNKVNSFESTSMAYKQPEIFKGFEKFELLKNKWNKIREEEKRK